MWTVSGWPRFLTSEEKLLRSISRKALGFAGYSTPGEFKSESA
jgi:hypothetical protein